MSFCEDDSCTTRQNCIASVSVSFFVFVTDIAAIFLDWKRKAMRKIGRRERWEKGARGRERGERRERKEGETEREERSMREEERRERERRGSVGEEEREREKRER